MNETPFDEEYIQLKGFYVEHTKNFPDFLGFDFSELPPETHPLAAMEKGEQWVREGKISLVQLKGGLKESLFDNINRCDKLSADEVSAIDEHMIKTGNITLSDLRKKRSEMLEDIKRQGAVEDGHEFRFVRFILDRSAQILSNKDKKLFENMLYDAEMNEGLKEHKELD